ncbi:hypothetical protein SAMN02745245_00517 [Anaerosphaera aminiphila DSM 21120]|uniref:Lipoprotein n=1 Tax=Anaerosphaera aminiphila DSM 21120 TaxID=1120995 RepID=A0A1M5Q6F9_9FIRM|nr:hypothetical protein [Anaerosphaera aminiphila]SHH09490.1 hypothetical protein SAMN02745245_00517 [Anaerosphaera aminiphila DSM 21120]
MRKIIALTLSLLLTGCINNPINSSSSNKVDNEIKNTITKYLSLNTYTGENIKFDENDTKTFNGETYARILGNDFNSPEDYNKMINNAFTKESAKDYLLEKPNTSNGILYTDKSGVYINKKVMEQPLQFTPDLNTLDVVTEKDDVLIVSYDNFYKPTKETYPLYVTLVKENDKYLIDNYKITNCKLAGKEHSKIIREHYNIPDDKSTFIGLISQYKDKHFAFVVYTVKGKDLYLEQACDFDVDKNTIAPLTIEGQRKIYGAREELSETNPKVLNNIFEKLSPDSKLETLIASVPKDASPLFEKYIEFEELFPSEENNAVLNKYIVVPKYFTSFSLSAADGPTVIWSDSPFLGIKGSFKLKENINYETLLNFFAENLGD